MKRTIVVLAVAGGCGGTAHQGLPPAPAPTTSGVLAGPLCSGEHCGCRPENAPADGGAGVPDSPNRKRYEIHLGPSPHELWLTFAGTVLYKSAERADECFYVDLGTGDHPMEFRARNPDGVSAAFHIREYGVKAKSWYKTFDFACGSPGVCSFAEMDGMKDDQALHKRNLRDPCGSTKIKGVAWDHGKAADQEHPSDLRVKLDLDVYKFAPWRPSGDPQCGEGGGRGPTELDSPDQ